MAKKSDGKKIKRMSIEKVQTGDGKPAYKVSHEYHPSKGKAGKGFGASLGGYHEPEDIYHSTAGKAKKHMSKNFHRIVANPEEQISNPELSGSEDQAGEESMAGSSVKE